MILRKMIMIPLSRRVGWFGYSLKRSRAWPEPMSFLVHFLIDQLETFELRREVFQFSLPSVQFFLYGLLSIEQLENHTLSRLSQVAMPFILGRNFLKQDQPVVAC